MHQQDFYERLMYKNGALDHCVDQSHDFVELCTVRRVKDLTQNPVEHKTVISNFQKMLTQFL